VYYPYTSLQYHVLLLTAALLHNYRARHAFEDLFLVATTPDVTPNADAVSTRDPKTALAADAVEPHRTVLWTPEMTLHVTATPGDRPAARLGDVPARSFADVWSRLPAHPFDTDGERRWRLLDAQLRRIRSWSAALASMMNSSNCTARRPGNWRVMGRDSHHDLEAKQGVVKR